MSDDLFSAGFAWDDVAEPATRDATPDRRQSAPASPPVSHAVATPDATSPTPSFSGDFGWGSDNVATVATVASVADAYGARDVSQSAPVLAATPDATSETAVFCGKEGADDGSVADVATVASWLASVERMARARRPEPIGEHAWRTLVMDARLLVQNWGADLIALGWTTLEVFGANRNPAARRLDVVGLVPLLRGRAVEAIDCDTALIRATPRDTLTFQRRLIAGGGVPVWKWVEEGSPVGRLTGLGRGSGEAPSALPLPDPRCQQAGGRGTKRNLEGGRGR